MDNQCMWYKSSSDEDVKKGPPQACKEKKCNGLNPNCDMYTAIGQLLGQKENRGGQSHRAVTLPIDDPLVRQQDQVNDKLLGGLFDCRDSGISV